MEKFSKIGFCITDNQLNIKNDATKSFPFWKTLLFISVDKLSWIVYNFMSFSHNFLFFYMQLLTV